MTLRRASDSTLSMKRTSTSKQAEAHPTTGRATVAALLGLMLSGAFAPHHACAEDMTLRSVSVRTQVGEKSRVIGQIQPESFYEYDLAASFQLPWEQRFPPGLEAQARLLTHLGILRGQNKTALVVTAIPVLVVGRQAGQLKADLGLGLAWLSRHRFELQDFGGPLQFALTLGVGAPLSRRVELGYRFMHYSDAGFYAPRTIGADMHMVEVHYLF